MLEIEECKDARIIIDFSEKNGLPDIGLWTNRKSFQKYLDDNILFAYIAKISKELSLESIVGAISAEFEEEGRIWLESLAVSQEYRRRGIGKALIDKICKIAKEKSYRACFIDVDINNSNAISLYEKLSFICVGKIKYYYYNDADALIYMKRTL